MTPRVISAPTFWTPSFLEASPRRDVVELEAVVERAFLGLMREAVELALTG
jgi:hypothetical protein